MIAAFLPAFGFPERGKDSLDFAPLVGCQVRLVVLRISRQD